MKKSIISLIFFVFLGCKDSEPSNFTNSLSGFYKVTSINSAKFVDMNNDGFISNDIFSEISKPHFLPDGKQISLHNFESFVNMAEIRPLPAGINNAKLVAFRFPHQQIDSLWDGQKFGKKYNSDYTSSFDTFTYNFGKGDEIILKDGNPNFNLQFGKLLTFKRIAKDILELKLTKRVYNFAKNEWVSIDLLVNYQKVENPF